MTLPITAVFDDIPDPRRDNANKVHRLTDILTIATCAVICGADSSEAIAEFGRSKEAFFRRFLKLTGGIPSGDTFRRLFAKLAPDAFAQAFGRWMASVCEATGLVSIAIDGKSARSAPQDTATGCLHLVSAWAGENRLTLGPVAVPDGSGEVAVIPELLRVLDLAGAIVTLDAAGTQVENARIIREQKGHYLLAVTGNQPKLQAAVEGCSAVACASEFAGVDFDQFEEITNGHGRHEERYVTVIYDPPGLPAVWPDVAAIVEVSRERTVNGTHTSTTHYYLTSHRGTAAQLAGLVRGHWGIENGLNWVLDVVFGEDRSRVRDGHAGANLALLRRVAVSLLKNASGQRKLTTPTKRLKAGWDDDYLLSVLQGFTKTVVR